MTEPLLSVRDAVVEFDGPRPGNIFARRTRIQALRSVSVAIAPGETVGLVGESGSGKSTLAKAILGIVPLAAGEIRWDGEHVRTPRAIRHAASTHAQLVFQDPYSSLNPMMTVGDTLVEVLKTRVGRDSARARSDAAELLDAVHLPRTALDRYPSEFSGGQRQRIVIARAIAARPELLVCDEPLSSLDVTTQARMIGLLDELRRELGMAMLFIGHDLSVVRRLSDRMLVMYAGEVVEEGPSADVIERPVDPYTRRLISSIPVADPAIQRKRRAERMAAVARTTEQESR